MSVSSRSWYFTANSRAYSCQTGRLHEGLMLKCRVYEANVCDLQAWQTQENTTSNYTVNVGMFLPVRQLWALEEEEGRLLLEQQAVVLHPHRLAGIAERVEIACTRIYAMIAL